MTNRFVAALLFVLLVAAGCSSSDSDTTVESTSASEVAESDAAAAPEEEPESSDSSEAEVGGGVAAGETSMAASSPIGAFFNDGGGFEQSIADYSIKVEEKIVVCMAEQGFEFRQSGVRPGEAQQRQNELTEREWTTIYGYGISTEFESLVADQGADPNAEIFMSMQPAERDAWVTAIAGENANLGGVGDTDTPLEEQGCVGQALIDTGGQEIFEGLEEAQETYDEGIEGIYDEPVMIDAVAAWTRCMSESGFPDYSEVDAPEEDFGDRLTALTVGLDAAINELSPEDGQALIEGDKIELDDLPGLDVEALRKLQEEEIKVALADLDCFEGNVADEFYPRRDALENGLLDQFEAEFDNLRTIGG